MKLSNKSILLISPEPWDHIHISKHHYAIELSKRNNNVYFLGPPSKSYSVHETSYSNVRKLKYKGFPKGIRFYPQFIRRWIQKSIVKNLEKLAGCQFDVIWSFDNSVFIDFENSNSRINISHIVDFSQDFSFTKVAKSADINFAVSENILNKQLNHNTSSYIVRHAIDEIFFDKKHIDQKIKLPGKNDWKAMTFGNLKSPYIDWDLALKIYDNFKNIDFIHAGPYKDNPVHSDNVFYLGPLEKSDLPGMMQQVDFLFIFYDYKNNKQQLTNSHKILECLSSGKPLICNFFSDYQESNLLLQCKVEDDYIKAINSVISNPENTFLKQSRIDFAKANTYHQRLNEIEKILEKF